MRTNRLPLIVSLAALAFAGRMVLLAVPNVSLSYLVVFIAGVAFGPLVGASTGLLARLATDLTISGPNPILLPMAPVEGAFGACAGWIGRAWDLGQRGRLPTWRLRLSVGGLAFLYTAMFSIIVDTVSLIPYASILPSAGDAKVVVWATLVVSGLLFSIPAIVFNVVLFPATVPPILRALREAGLLPGAMGRTSSSPAPVRPAERPALAAAPDAEP